MGFFGWFGSNKTAPEPAPVPPPKVVRVKIVNQRKITKFDNGLSMSEPIQEGFVKPLQPGGKPLKQHIRKSDVKKTKKRNTKAKK